MLSDDRMASASSSSNICAIALPKYVRFGNKSFWIFVAEYSDLLNTSKIRLGLFFERFFILGGPGGIGQKKLQN